jgi:hypothetical protein
MGLTVPRFKPPPKEEARRQCHRAIPLSLERIVAWSAAKVLMAHGTPVTEDGNVVIRRVFHWLVA